MNSTTHSFGENFYPAALLRTFVWSIGEVDWKGTMKEKRTNATCSIQDCLGTMKEVGIVETVLGYIILLIFIFFFVIVMTNLLNALAIGDIEVRYNM